MTETKLESFLISKNLSCPNRNKDSYSMLNISTLTNILVFPGASVIENPPANAGDAGLIPGSGRSPEE